MTAPINDMTAPINDMTAPESPPAVAPASRLRRLAWFVGLWLASVALTVTAAGALRWLFRQMLR